MLEIYEFGQQGRELYALAYREMHIANTKLAYHSQCADGAQRIARRALDEDKTTSAHDHLRARTKHRARTSKSDKNKMEKSPQHQATRSAPRRPSETTARARNRARDDMMGALVKRPQLATG